MDMRLRAQVKARGQVKVQEAPLVGDLVPAPEKVLAMQVVGQAQQEGFLGEIAAMVKHADTGLFNLPG
ncbi:MAG: hypothetical protein RR983_15370 [Massilia sp.]|uniref:hypothetical protein n=1 Tax=Massilia sp. TaxID=1882437 RepID=UPI002FC9E74E